MQTIFDNISRCIKEYGMKINGKKSKVVCINGAKEERSLNFGGCEIGEVEEYKYRLSPCIIRTFFPPI